MGIVNVTPDSFSDGNLYLDPAAAVDHALALEAGGAAILDIGGESTRPGAPEVPQEEELRRVLPVIKALARQTAARISIDTSKAAVARAALDDGAQIINDVTGLTGDPDMEPLAAESRAGLVVMHMRGRPRTMQDNPVYADVAGDIITYLRNRLQRLEELGIDPRRVVLDPGIGFGKTVSHNLEIINRLHEFDSLKRPLLLGVSRKSFLGKVLGSDDLEARFWPTVALTALGRARGARIFRVHDAEPNLHALRMTEAILRHA